jgi:cytidylate kinase
MLRVFVTASPRTRAQRVSEQGDGDMVAAERIVKTSDAGRRDYLKRFYEVAEELPTHYDLVVNTDGISVEEAAELVAHVAGGRSTLTAPA